MTRQKAGGGFGYQPELFFEMRYEFLRKRPAPGTIVHRIGELVMACRASPIKEDVNHFGLFARAHRLSEGAGSSPCRCVVAAESMDVIDGGIVAAKVLSVVWRQYHTRTH